MIKIHILNISTCAIDRIIPIYVSNFVLSNI